jgi:hypothetical protein
VEQCGRREAPSARDAPMDGRSGEGTRLKYY